MLRPSRVESVASRFRGRMRGRIELWMLLAILAYSVLASSYFVMRSGGYWSENDTAQQTMAIRGVGESGSLVPETGRVYPSGYGYAAASSVLLSFTGLSASTMQQLVYPLLSSLLVLPAWALYRELTGSRWAAGLATCLLFLQPEFLFVVFRGSHERMLRTLMLVSIWLLVRSFRFRGRPMFFAIHIGFFYLTAYGIIATNALFGMSFIAAIAIAMATAWICGRIRPSLFPLVSTTAGRLAMVTTATLALGFLFVFYVYPPAVHSLQALDGLVEKLGAVFLATDATTVGVNPYSQVAGGWISLPVYFLVSIGDYLLVLATAPIWLWKAVQWLRGTAQPPSLGPWLLWLLWGAFGLQGAFAIVGDYTGLMGGNLQHRSFPSFAMIATPLIATALIERRPRLWEKTAVGGVLAFLAALALIKATNEPSLSNKWMFFTPAEMLALEWADQHDTYSTTWVGFDERLSSAFLLAKGDSTQYNEWDVYALSRGTRSFLISDVIRMQGARLRRPLPPIAGANRIYDSGTVQIYRLRPETPFQR